jgi:hypothetical protein
MPLAAPAFVRRALRAILVAACLWAAPRAALAQIDSRLALGADFGFGTSDRAQQEDYAHGQFTIGPLVRFGATEPGWGFQWGLNWYAVDIDRPIGGGPPTELGELRLKPFMAGYGYTWIVGKKNAIVADLLGGYAFASFGIKGAAADAYRARTGAQLIDAEASNTFVLRPEIAFWHDLNRRVGLNINVGYMIARPEVVITTSAGVDRRTARADQFVLKAGLVYSIF